MANYFLDTWALIEILRDNPAYRRISSADRFATTRLNLMEMAFWLRVRDMDAASPYRDFLPHVYTPSDDTMLQAVEFRKAHPEPAKPGRYRFSYVDAIGYTLARELGIPFVTGDRDFRELPGVEYLR